MINVGMMKATHASFDAALKSNIESTLRDHNRAALTEAKQELQQHVRTGKLLASTKGYLLKLGNRIVSRGEMGRGVKYARGFEHGTQPHVIKAKRAKFLRFIGRRDGAVVYAKLVNHPGNRPFFVLGGAWWKMSVRYATVLRANMHYLAQTKFR